MRWADACCSFPGQKHKCLGQYGRGLNSGDSSRQVRQSLSLFPCLPFVRHKIKPFLASCCNAGAVKLVFMRSTVLKEQERTAAPRYTLIHIFDLAAAPNPVHFGRIDGVEVGSAGDPVPLITGECHLHITRCPTVSENSS